MEREWPQASSRSWREDWETNAFGLEKVGCWIPQSSMVSSAADSSPTNNTLAFPPYDPILTITTSPSSSSAVAITSGFKFEMGIGNFFLFLSGSYNLDPA
jgi:hypothetical protein